MLEKTRFGHVPDRVFFVCRYVCGLVACWWACGRLFWIAGMRDEMFTQVVGLARTSKSTLISLDESYRKVVEPGAAPYEERISALRALHDAGCKTWVSIEPYPSPNLIQQSLSDILAAVSFVDRIIFGRTNYNKAVSAFPDVKTWYSGRAREVIAYCEEYGIDCHIKKGTML